MTSASTVAVSFLISSSRTLFILAREITIPPSIGKTQPLRLVPEPRPIMGILFPRQP
ncbi:hypothetical protein Vsou_05240 [Vulcanisaeta souniana JCM 11219]|uniref:Uncharacterized protein n=1 Tax=Vulcanisaeta souniana JCM 11219 TaxID=1293586 RepID=A0ABN6SNF6_9CREN|nr:hypothetical protein Vsou_05240 [Vulcanisaeta souniana JCM 11219]